VNKFLDKLIENDSLLNNYSHDKDIIQQGLAPLLAAKNKSLLLQKNLLYEQLKSYTWDTKAVKIFNLLHEKKIRFIVFKGFAFTHCLYNSEILRPYSDIDILINKKDYASVSEIFQQLSFKCFPSRQGQFVSFQNSFFDDETPPMVIDLHWQINNRIEFHHHFPFENLYFNCYTIKVKNLTFKTLNMEFAYIIGCFHYYAHRPEHRKHIWLYDLALIWNSMDYDCKQRCIALAQNSKNTQLVQSSLKLLNATFTRCFDDLPVFVINKKEFSAKFLKPRNNKFVDIINRIRSIKGLKNKLKFCSEYIVQDKNYMQNRFNLKSKKWLFLYYPRMWFQDIIKLFKKN